MRKFALAAFAASLCYACGLGAVDAFRDGDGKARSGEGSPQTGYIVLDGGAVPELNDDDTWRSRPPVQRVFSLCDTSEGDSLDVGSFHVRRDAIREVYLSADDIWGVRLLPSGFLGGCVGLEKLAADFPMLPKLDPVFWAAVPDLGYWR